MDNLENIYNQAIELQKKGHSKEQVLLEFVNYKNELAPLLNVSQALLSLPKNIVPTPLMQRKYALAPGKIAWLAWLHVSKFASISLSLMLLVSAFVVTGYAAQSSGPGQPLFGIKKTEEKLQLVLATNQSQKASIQITIAEQRLSDAQEIFSNPESNTDKKIAALNELADQTSSAVATVDDATKNNPGSSDTHPLLNSLETITQAQQNLLKTIKPDNEIKVATTNAQESLNKSSAQISQIKVSVAAASNNQTLATLKSDPNSVAVLGEISQISAGQITVEKTTFVLNDQTEIKDSLGKTITVKDLKQDIKVNIVGIKSQNVLTAKQVLITEIDTAKGEVKSASSTNVSVIMATSSTSSTASVIKTPVSTSSVPTIDPNTANGSYIFESPSAQYLP